MNDDPFEDEPTECNPPCQHGWVEVYQDAEGKYLGHDRWSNTTGRVPVTQLVIDPETKAPLLDEGGNPVTRTAIIDLVKTESTYPCPIHEPELFLRWQEGKLGSDRPQKRGSRT